MFGWVVSSEGPPETVNFGSESTVELNDWKTPVRGMCAAKAAAALIAPPPASAEIKSLTGASWWERLLYPSREGLRSQSLPRGGPAVLDAEGKCFKAFRGPRNSHNLSN